MLKIHFSFMQYKHKRKSCLNLKLDFTQSNSEYKGMWEKIQMHIWLSFVQSEPTSCVDRSYSICKNIISILAL